MGSIVNARTEHHLGVNLQAAIAKPGQLLHDLARPGIFEQARSHLRFRRMHRHKQRRQPQLLNPIPLPLGQVCQGQIRAIEKTQPVIIIFVVERGPLAGRLLINKAKGAAVVALNQSIKQSRFKFQT
jgi:hypothetical protein